MDEENKKEFVKRATRSGKKSGRDIEAGDSCAQTSVKSIWIVGIAVIVLVSIFCIALFNSPKPSTKLPLTSVNAQGVAMEGFAMPMLPQYAMDPILQQFSATPAAMGTYGPTCPPNGRYQSAMTQVAMAGAHSGPPIFRDAIMPHQYRGVCENCHIVSADIPIPANSTMRHEYRGVCSNCHTIIGVTNTAGAAAGVQ